MRRSLYIISASVLALLCTIYFGGYFYFKCACMSKAFVPSNPWKGSSDATTMRSKVILWGSGDISTMTLPLPHKDPGIELGTRFSETLNAIYLPLRKIDESISGWSVKFKSDRSDIYDIQ